MAALVQVVVAVSRWWVWCPGGGCGVQVVGEPRWWPGRSDQASQVQIGMEVDARPLGFRLTQRLMLGLSGSD